MTFGELSVLGLFSLLVVMWFSRDPGFVDGWATALFNSEAELIHFLLSSNFQHVFAFSPSTYISLHFYRYVTDATVAIFIAVLLFVLPSKAPSFCCRRPHSFGTGEP